jgi:hypothetical protein
MHVRYVHWRRQSLRYSLWRWSTKIVEKKILRTQSLNTLKSHYHTIEIILQKRIQKIENTNSSFAGNIWRLVSIFLSIIVALFSFSLLFCLPQEQEQKNVATLFYTCTHCYTLIVLTFPLNNALKFLSCVAALENHRKPKLCGTQFWCYQLTLKQKCYVPLYTSLSQLVKRNLFQV